VTCSAAIAPTTTTFLGGDVADRGATLPFKLYFVSTRQKGL